MDEILTKFNLKYEDLNSVEKETLTNMMMEYQGNILTVERMKEHFSSMRDAVSEELSKTLDNTRQDIYLKARLRNYTMIIMILSAPEKNRKKIEEALKHVKK